MARRSLAHQTGGERTLGVDARYLMHADEILFLDAGRIVERGTHAELLAQNGRYRALFDLQMGVARDDARV